MKVGIIGLGVTGGSLAKAYQSSETAEVYGYDIDEAVRDFTLRSGALDGILTKEQMPDCDLLLLAIPPKAVVTFIRKYAPCFGKKPLLVDFCGVKRMICDAVFPLAEKYGFTFLGGHPMTETTQTGFQNSKSDHFWGKQMILVPQNRDSAILDRAEKLLAPIGFSGYMICTAEEHDRLAAVTSQLAQIVSCACVQNTGIEKNNNLFTENDRATEPAGMDVDHWTELLLSNSDNIKPALDTLIDFLGNIRSAVAQGNTEKLRGLLSRGEYRNGVYNTKWNGN